MRAAVVLRYYADLSVDEVATALGKSPNTIKAQLQTALDRLRVHLAEPVGAGLGSPAMHDGQLEERLRDVLRAEGDALPLTITTAELERRLALGAASGSVAERVSSRRRSSCGGRFAGGDDKWLVPGNQCRHRAISGSNVSRPSQAVAPLRNHRPRARWTSRRAS